MDSMKLIKKHGSPGGLPVMTVYIDADAPGEAPKMYLHHIQTTASGSQNPAFIDLISSSATAYTAADVAKILYDLGLDSSQKVWAATSVLVGTTGTINCITGFYSSNGTTLKAHRSNFIPTITDNTIAYTTSSSTSDISSVVDRIVEIK